MCSGRSDWALPQPGFPIRRSTDQSLVDSSPWLFAATHVLHRHLAPRHPPLALCNLKSHTPHCFLGRKKHKEPLLSRRSCSLCSSQGSRRSRAGFEAAVRAQAGNSTPSHQVRLRAARPGRNTPVLPSRVRGETPLPQNRAVNTRHDRVSVVPATARPLESGWLVHRGRERTVVTSNQ